MKIPFFNYPDFFKSNEELFLDVIRNVGNKGAFILQNELKQFEEAIAEYVGSKYAIGVSNATDGLQMVFMASGLNHGDEIIFSSHTMVATASAIHFAGGVPIPVEAGPDHLINPDKIEGKLTDKTKAICVTQLNGRTANMDRIRRLAEKYNLMIFEDAAQALGSKYKGKCAGTFGVGACISFYPAKILGCLGDGGAVITNDHKIYSRVLLLRDHGRSVDGNIEMWGFNARLDNIQAAILHKQLNCFDKVVQRRREIASNYNKYLKNINQVKLPPPPEIDGDHFDVFQNYEIEATDRDSLREFLKSHEVGTLLQWGGKAVHQFPKLGFTAKLQDTELMMEKSLMLPLNMTITDAQVRHITTLITQYYQK